MENYLIKALLYIISELQEEITWDFLFWVLSSLHKYVQKLQVYIHIHILLPCHQTGILETIDIPNSNMKWSS